MIDLRNNIFYLFKYWKKVVTFKKCANFVEIDRPISTYFKDTPGPTDPKDQQLSSFPFPDTEMMVIFGVPAKHKTPDLLQFTAPCHGDLEYMRVIHDGSPNQGRTQDFARGMHIFG
jgi:hypothetical protein